MGTGYYDVEQASTFTEFLEATSLSILKRITIAFKASRNKLLRPELRFLFLLQLSKSYSTRSTPTIFDLFLLRLLVSVIVCSLLYIFFYCSLIVMSITI